MDDVMNRQMGDAFPEGFEERLRKVQLIGMVLAGVAAASLAVAMVMDPVPLLFPVLAAALGAAYGAANSLTLSLSGKSMPGIGAGLVSGLLIVGFFKMRDMLFPGMADDFLAHLWPGASAWVLGLAAVAIPLSRRNVLRMRPELRADIEAVSRFRERGDSAFVAQIRTSAMKMEKGDIIALMAMAGFMAGLGLFVWLTADDILGIIGLAFAGLVGLQIAFLAWMLKLKRSS